MALQICTEEQLQKFRTIMAAEIQKALGLPLQISPRALLAELGIMDPAQEIELEALRIFGRIARKTAGLQVLHMLRVRKEDMNNNEKIGFYPNIYKLLQKINLAKVWSLDTLDKKYNEQEWKELIRERMNKRANSEWRKFACVSGKTHNNYQLHKMKVVQEGYLSQGTKLGVKLVMCYKLGGMKLRGNKWAEELKTNKRFCELCKDKNTIENEDHLLECSQLINEKNKMLVYLDKIKRSNKWRQKGTKQLQKELLKTWTEQKGIKTGSWSLKKDIAFKKFLERVMYRFKAIGRNIVENAFPKRTNKRDLHDQMLFEIQQKNNDNYKAQLGKTAKDIAEIIQG
jgi:hypothetical protein